jgi:RNA polymerase sigma factor (TIGR02999 family)
VAFNPITQLMQDWRAGTEGAEAQLLKLVYPAMKEIAGRQLRKARQFTLRPTELANDVFMQMRKSFGQDTENSTQFYALAAHMIRCFIVDHIREVQAQKRGTQFEIVSLEFAGTVIVEQAAETTDWLALDIALTSLAGEDKRHATLVELRYFMGMSIKEAADVMQISTATADRIWRYARVFLAKKLTQVAAQGSDSRFSGVNA